MSEEQLKLLTAGGLGAEGNLDVDQAIENVRGRKSGRISKFWSGFGGQVFRGERSAAEIAAGFTKRGAIPKIR